jgi:hypothetical protein
LTIVEIKDSNALAALERTEMAAHTDKKIGMLSGIAFLLSLVYD